jgi:hypothetical protein
MLVPEDFKVLPFLIPVDSDSEGDNTLQDFIDQEEKIALEKILGPLLYDEYAAGIAVETPAEKWTQLKNGATYTIRGTSYKYSGLKDLLKPFVFHSWLKEYATTSITLNGVVTVNSDNSTKVSHTYRLVQAYNKFSALVGNDCEWKHNFYGFMWANKDTYTTWEFSDPGTKNTFNL